MVTLRTYPNAVEAGIAKSRLDARNIACCLADEASNLYGGAPFAMPVRLLVREDQAEEARRILNEPGQTLPDDFTPANQTGTAELPEAVDQQILEELRELRQRYWWTRVLLFMLIILTIYLVVKLPGRATSPWVEVYRARRQYKFDRALQLAKTIALKHPNDYYAHESLGDIYFDMGDLANAESEYSRAYELAPPGGVQEKLRDVQKRRGTLPTPAPSLSPWP